jgi:hypothetical protein
MSGTSDTKWNPLVGQPDSRREPHPRRFQQLRMRKTYLHRARFVRMGLGFCARWVCDWGHQEAVLRGLKSPKQLADTQRRRAGA